MVSAEEVTTYTMHYLPGAITGKLFNLPVNTSDDVGPSGFWPAFFLQRSPLLITYCHCKRKQKRRRRCCCGSSSPRTTLTRDYQKRDPLLVAFSSCFSGDYQRLQLRWRAEKQVCEQATTKHDNSFSYYYYGDYYTTGTTSLCADVIAAFMAVHFRFNVVTVSLSSICLDTFIRENPPEDRGGGGGVSPQEKLPLFFSR